MPFGFVAAGAVGASLLGGGGGGGGGSSGGGTASGSPTQSTVYNTNIPDYAQPYVQNMLQSAQAQMYQTNPDGTTQLKGYTPYSQNPSDYFAGFSPLQQQAQSSAANLRVPGQYAQATGLATQAGQGMLGTTNQAMGYGSMGSNYGGAAASLAPQAQQYGQNAADIGMGGLNYGAAGMNAGMQGAGYGAIGAQQGLSYGQNATNANAVQSYMNPYLQATLNPAMQLQNQQFGQINAQNQGQATQQGAFGGGRQAIMEGLNQQNQMLAQNQLVGNAYNQAYNTANQNMQAASQLGMQGAGLGIQGQNAAMQGAGLGLQSVNTAMQGQQAGLQGLQQAGSLYGQGMQGAQIGLAGVNAQQAGYAGAGTQAQNLGNLGAQELAAQQGIIGTQAAQGSQQQQLEQNKINQSVQNYATAQQYPYMELGTLNSLLRGLPMQQATTSTYMAQPTTTQQAIGLAGAAGSLMKAEGGVIKMAKGGIADVPGYKYGTLINDAQLENDARKLGAIPAQPGQPSPLQQRIQDPMVNPDERAMFQGVMADQNRLRQIPGAGQAIAQAGMPAPQPQQVDRMSGIAQAGGPAFASLGSPVRMAGGGILAFAGDGEEGSQVKDPMAALNAAPDTPEQQALITRQNMLKSLGINPGMGEKGQALMQAYNDQVAGGADKLDKAKRYGMAQGFLDFASTPGPIGVAAAKGLRTYATAAQAAEEAADAAKIAGLKGQSALEDSNRKYAEGDVDGAIKSYQEAEKLKKDRDVADLQAKTQLQVANVHAGAAGQASALEKQAVEQYMKDHPGTTWSDAYQQIKSAARGESNEIAAIRVGLADAQQRLLMEKDPAKRKAIQDEITLYTNKIKEAAKIGSPAAPNPTTKTPDTVSSGGKTYKRSDYPKMTDEQWTNYANSVTK